MNRYAKWKYILLVVVAILGLLYAIPNYFGETPAIQISSALPGQVLTSQDLAKISDTLQKGKTSASSLELLGSTILAKFKNIDDQAEAKSLLQTQWGNQYTVAMTLTPAAPAWLLAIGAEPMRLGLDLRGGVDFLLQVDTDAVILRHYQGAVRNAAENLRNENIPYASVELSTDPRQVQVSFASSLDLKAAQGVLAHALSDFQWQAQGLSLRGNLTPMAVRTINQDTLDQTLTSFQRRVNALGVSEATVQQAGADRISVSLPGIQDPAQAKSILGKTATLEFRLVDTQHQLGDQVFYYQGQAYPLKSRVLLTGDSITDANAGYDQNGRPNVSIRLGGSGEAQFYRVTGENVGQLLAVVYTELHPHTVMVKGQARTLYTKDSQIISVATIQSALPSPFEVTGLASDAEAKNLAILLKAGALVAPTTILADHTIGPSMGQQNIAEGMHSVEVGLLLVVIFMIIYYQMFGLIADLGLVLNLIFLVAALSLLGAVVTFPGIAAIVLNIGMAVDANVLIYERIREELRQGMGVQAAIHAGYEKAFVTIVDANVTTLIAAIALFSLGAGPIKGFAITLTLGLLTSVFSAVVYTRALVNGIYGGRRVKQLAIGIHLPARKAAN